MPSVRVSFRAVAIRRDGRRDAAARASADAVSKRGARCFDARRHRAFDLRFCGPACENPAGATAGLGELRKDPAASRCRTSGPIVEAQACHRASPVARSLQFEHLRVAARERHQLVVTSLLRDAAVLQDHDAIGHAHGREAVRNQQRHLPAGQLGEALEHFVLGPGVERSRRLIENQQLRVAQIGAGQGDLLPLSAGEVERRPRSGARAVDRSRAAGGRSQRRRGSCAPRSRSLRSVLVRRCVPPRCYRRAVIS